MNRKYFLRRFSFVIADFSLKATSLKAELSVCMPHCTCMPYCTNNVVYMNPKNCNSLFTMLWPYMCQQKSPSMPLECHICKLLHVQMSDSYINIYPSYKLAAINTVTRSTGTHILHYWHMPLNTYACHIAHTCPLHYYCSLQ